MKKYTTINKFLTTTIFSGMLATSAHALEFICPVSDCHNKITSPFDANRQPRPHNGVDFGVYVGTSIIAPADGTVIEVGQNKYVGKFLILEHKDNYKSIYLHMDEILVQVDQKVSQKTPIALSGKTGRVTGPCLHFEIRKSEQPIDPMSLLHK